MRVSPGLDNKRIEAQPSGKDALDVRHSIYRCPRAIARHENGRWPNQAFVISSVFLLGEMCFRLRTNGSLNSTAGESYRRQGRFRLQNGADIIGKFANASEAPAAALYDAGVPAPPPPAVFKTTVGQRLLQAMSTLQPLANYSAVLAHDLPRADSSTAYSTL
jgi:hypothetical protein